MWFSAYIYLEHDYEKNISAQRPETQAYPWFPRSHGYQGWPPRIEPPSRERSQAPVSLKWCDWVSEQSANASFGKARRLLNAKDYSRVFDGAEVRASHKHLLLLAKKNIGPWHRLGLVIAKKNVRLAVQRNRIKRVAREFFRTLPPSETPLDVVFLARRGIGQLDNSELSTILQQQWQKLVRHASKLESSTNRDS